MAIPSTNTGPALSVFRQVLRDEFEALAPELRAFHDVRGQARFRGRCRIESAGGPAGRLLCRVLRLPRPAEDREFEFELTATPERELWRRDFPGRSMRSMLRARGGSLVERIGPVSLHFSLRVAAGRLAMVLTRVTVLGLPLPRAWMPQVWGNERAGEGFLYFDAGARLPRLGLLTAYTGHLAIAPRGPARDAT